MPIARHRHGPRAAVGALASQVHPVFMAPPVALSAVGTALGGGTAPAVAALHATAIFFAVYTAHVRDGYVDFYRRGEDDDARLSPGGCRLALVAASLGFAACAAGLWTLAGTAAALAVAPAWLLGVLHAPYLDTRPLTTTLGYPAGNALALVSAAYAQAGTVAPPTWALAGVLLVLLAGVKVIDDAPDREFDRSIGKRTVAVVLGVDRARTVGVGLIVAGLGLTAAFAALGPFPTGAILGVFALGAVLAVARDRPAAAATALLVRGGYAFIALVAAAFVLEPMTGPPPVDVTALGEFTYLATEVVFGVVALALLVRAGAVRTAARSIAALYPVAYLWDWYTLEVGVFSIPMRTGVELLGIPIEEHLFMVVVPALVIGVHETLGQGT